MIKFKLIGLFVLGFLGIINTNVFAAENTENPIRSSHPMIPIVTDIPQLKDVTGILYQTNIGGLHYELQTKDTLYVLSGEITNIENLVGQTVTISGYAGGYQYNPYDRGSVLNVKSYKSDNIVEETTSIIGTVFIDVDNGSYIGVKTPQGIYRIEGLTSGLSDLEGKTALVIGYKNPNEDIKTNGYTTLYSVKSHEIDKSKELYVTGWITSIDNDAKSDKHYELFNGGGRYSVEGNTSGLENYDGKTDTNVVLKGYILSEEDTDINTKPISNVSSSKIIKIPRNAKFIMESFTTEPVKETSIVGSIPSLFGDTPIFYSDQGSYELEGNVKDLKEYVNKDDVSITLNGYVIPNKFNYPTLTNTTINSFVMVRPKFHVYSFTVKSTKEPLTIFGKITTSELEGNGLVLNTDKGVFSLLGKESELKRFADSGITITIIGYTNSNQLGTSMNGPILNVNSYKIDKSK